MKMHALKKSKTVIFFLIAFFFLLSIHNVSALEDQGKQAGESASDYVKSQIGDTSSIDSKLAQPLTQQNVPLKSLDGTRSGTATAFCGQGTVQNEKLAFQVTVNTASVSVSSDTNNDGTLDSSSNFSVTKVCIDGYQVGNPPSASYYTWTVSSTGYISSTSSGALNGCMDPIANPPTYAGGAISQRFAESTGRTITNSSFSGSTATYYSGEIKDCGNIQKDVTATKYYDNPYLMNDAAIQQSISCSQSDPRCQAYSGLRQGAQNFSSSGGSSTAACTITRNIIDQKGPQNGIICEGNKLYYPNGYSETSQICFKTAGQRWDYNSMFRARCDSYGKQLTLEAWAYWEGAPCGTYANHPPDIQIKYPLSYGGSYMDTIIGQFSVNRRMDGDNVAGNDQGDVRCYSDVNPMRVHLSHTCGSINEYCNYQLTVENAPACSTALISLSPPTGENIDNQCSSYEDQSTCKLVDEWWYDATGNKVQMVQNGAPLNNFLESSCKTFAVVGTVCKEWWKKDRVYSCESDNKKYDPDLSRAYTVSTTADNKDTDTILYQKSVLNTEKTSTCIGEIIISVGQFESKQQCESLGGKLSCPPNYSYNSQTNLCEKNPTCPSGSTFNPVSDSCEIASSPVCPANYQYDLPTQSCRAAPICTTGTYSPISDKCEVDSSPTCAPGYSYNPANQSCESLPICSSSTFNPVTDLCEVVSNPVCESPYVFNSSSQKCETPPTCNIGVYNPLNDRCETAATFSCETNYTYNPVSQKCEFTPPSCPAGGGYVPANDRCETPSSNGYQCSLSGNVYATLETCLGVCTQTGNCAQISFSGSVSGKANKVIASAGGNTIQFQSDKGTVLGTITLSGATVNGSYNFSCPSKDYINQIQGAAQGTTNILKFTCYTGTSVNVTLSTPVNKALLSGGFYLCSGSSCDLTFFSFNGSNNKIIHTAVPTEYVSSSAACPLGDYTCSGGPPGTCSQSGTCNPVSTCPTGYSLSGSICIASATCPSSGTLDPITDLCVLNPTPNCQSGFSYNPVSQQCEKAPTCAASGILNPAGDICELTPTFCQSGFSYNGNGMCQKPPTCVSPGTLNASTDRCETTPTFCTSGFSFNPGTNRCERNPSCPPGGSLNPSTDFCEANATFCPSGFVYSPVTSMCGKPPTCESGGAFNGQTHKCESAAQCGKKDYQEIQCKYQNETTKSGLYCDINSYPIQNYEVSRKIFRDCIDSKQCIISCVLQIPDTGQPSGYRYEKRACTDNGNNNYTCPDGGYTIHKNCDCIIDTWDPNTTQYETCEVGCLVKSPTSPTGDSNVKNDYLIKNCDKTIENNLPVYTCPLATGESLYLNCGCLDGFGLSAGILGALVEAVNDRECIQ